MQCFENWRKSDIIFDMIELKWLGTASILLNIDGEELLFDPFFRMNKKVEKPPLETFTEVDYIFNTHSHFDHIRDVPQILKTTKAKFYGTPTAYLRLETQGVDVENKVEILCPHEKLETKNAVVKVLRTFHVKNDFWTVFSTTFRILLTFREHKALKVLGEHHHFHMAGDIVAYQVEAQGKKILIFGSAGFDESAKIPKDVDVLVWPFQGRTNMAKYSLPIVEKINPKKIVLDHFDNAFPPITKNVNTKSFEHLMKKKHPNIEVIVPQFGKSVEL